MSTSTDTPVADGVESMSLQDKPVEVDWEETDEDELDSFITSDQEIIPVITSNIRSEDRSTRLIATIKVRRLLQKRPPHVGVQPVINSGLVPIVVEMLSCDDVKFKAEAAWIVSNVASGTSEQTETVVEAGAIPKLVALFPTDVSDVQENGLWALGNIGGDSARFRDMVLNAGGLKPALDVLQAADKYLEKVRNTAAWVLTCYMTPRPGRSLGLSITGQMIPVIAKFLQEPSDSSFDTIGYAVKALDQICADEAAAEVTIETGVLPRLVEHCAKGSSDLRYNAIRCVGQFTAGSERSTDAAIEAGFLEALKSCIGYQLVMIRENACWAASNVAAGTLSQVQALLKADLLYMLVSVVRDKEEVQKPRNEATWALANLVNTAMVHPELVDPLIEGQCIEAFSDALVSHHYNTERLAVQSLQKLLGRESRSQEKVLQLLREANGIARLRATRDGASTRGTEVGKTAHEILKEHYPDFVRRARV